MMRFVLAFGLSIFVLFARPSLARAADQAATRPAAAAEARPTKLLVLTLTKGFKHDSIPTAVQVLRDLGESTGAFDPTITDDVSHFDPDRLNQFDAVLFCNTTGELPFTDVQKQALLDFVAGGKGFVGVHAATDTFYGWPAFGEMIGAYFDGHPWNSKDTVTIKADRPDHPIARCFAPAVRLTEEIYQFKAPYDRSKLEVLMSLDTSATDMTKKGIKRTDGDFAVAWTKPYGKGRVFYTSLGHNKEVWRDPRFQAHLLAGITWATGAGT
jgi:type 1 glutamine amidotransferase